MHRKAAKNNNATQSQRKPPGQDPTRQGANTAQAQGRARGKGEQPAERATRSTNKEGQGRGGRNPHPTKNKGDTRISLEQSNENN